jgi:hypothetical protein
VGGLGYSKSRQREKLFDTNGSREQRQSKSAFELGFFALRCDALVRFWLFYFFFLFFRSQKFQAGSVWFCVLRDKQILF